MTVVVFDLDDTLYDELTYVKSGFRAVADHMAAVFDVDAAEIFSWMWQRLNTHGRGSVFDDILKETDRYNRSRVRKLLSVYRLHAPNIRLDPEAESCLRRLASFPLYVVTDGNKIVQDQKLKALGLYDRMKGCFVTHRYGIHHAKPSPYCFLKIAEREQADPNRIVYIGDNPRKDFVGIKEHGFHTVRIMKGQHREVKVTEDYEAEHQIDSLAEIDEHFIRMMMA